MSEPRKTVILVILLLIGIATIFWGRWRLKAQLEQELRTPVSVMQRQDIKSNKMPGQYL